MARRLVAFLAFAAAVESCSTPYGGDAPPPPPDGGNIEPLDAGTSDTSTSDAGEGRCDPTKPFSAATAVAGLNSDVSEDDGARPSDDEKTIVFTSDRGASKRSRFYLAKRNNPDEPFAAPELFFEDSTEPVFDATLAVDGQSMVFQFAGKTTPARLRVVTRASAAFGAAIDLGGSHATGQDERDPFLTSDGRILFSRNASDGSVAGNLYIATRSAVSTVTDVAPIDELNTPAIERDPVLSSDGKEIFFSSDRNGTGKLRVFRATRASATGKFDTPMQVVEISQGTNFEAPTWLSPDRCVLYFSSDRGATTDIYRATRPK